MFTRSYLEPHESTPSYAVTLWLISISFLQQIIYDALWRFSLVRWCTPTRHYSVNAFIVTTITIPVLILFSITGCRHAVPLYDGTLHGDQSSVAYHRQWHLCVGIWTRVKLALAVLLLELKCSGNWLQKPVTGCFLVHIRATYFFKIFFQYYQPTFLEARIGLILQWNRDLSFRHWSFFRMYCSQFLVPN